MKVYVTILVCSWLGLVSSQVRAQEAETATTAVEQSPWKIQVKVGINFSFAHNYQVAAIQDGSTIQVGALLGSKFTYESGLNKWETLLDVQETFSWNSQTDEFTKAVDIAKLKSEYSRKFANPEWLSAIAGVTAETQLLEGEINREAPVNVTYKGETRTVDRLKITDPFEPLTLRESVGLGAEPYKKDEFELKLRLAAASQQIFVQGGQVILEDDGTNIVIGDLEDSVQGGTEGEVQLKGLLVKDIISWFSNFNIFLPLVGSEDSGDPTIKIKGGVSAKLSKWFALEYSISLDYVPLVSTKIQVQNNMLLTATFDVM